jgi:hypothetical protein
MDSPNDRLNRFIANSGAGVDAAGRPVYSGSGMMYMGPGESAATKQVHAGLEADATRHDPQGNLIRRLLDQLKMQNLPGNLRMQLPDLPNTSASYSIDNRGN